RTVTGVQTCALPISVEILVRHAIQPVVHPDDGLAEEVWTGPPGLDNLWLDAYFATYPEQMRRMPYKTLCAGHPDPLRVVAFASRSEERRVGKECRYR